MVDVKSKEKTDVQMYGSFYLCDCEFAIAATKIEQVVELPPSLVSVPKSPPFVRGMFDLRGTLIPVVDLELLFGLPESGKCVNTVAVVELGGQCIGLLFERTGEFFKGDNDELSNFDATTNNALVSGIFRRNSGKRPVQLVDVEALFNLPNIPRDASRRSAVQSLKDRNRGKRAKYMSFQLGETRCAIPISEVQEVFEVEKIKSSVLGVGSCIGTAEVRGGTIPIIDLSILLGHLSRNPDGSGVKARSVIVMRLESDLFGFLVDSIDDIIAAYPDEIVPFPSIDLVKTDLFLGCIVREDSAEVLVFRSKEILAHREIRDVTRIHGKCPSSLRLHSERKKANAGEEQETFLTFSAATRYAVRIKEIQEIIDLPVELLRPPGLSTSFSGIHNLRGQTLVTIADLREADSEKKRGKMGGEPKVLIFNANGGKAGLIVDSVDSIDSIHENEKIMFPSDPHQGFNAESEMRESIPTVDPSGQQDRISVVEMQSLLDLSSSVSC